MLKHLTREAPSRLPRSMKSAQDGGFPFKDLDRVFRALERLQMWQCRSCYEIFDKSYRDVFGVCVDCFSSNEDIDEVIECEKLDDRSIFSHWVEWTTSLHARLPIQHSNTTRPLEMDLLAVLWSCVGTDRMKEALRARAVKAFLHPDNMRWVSGLGLIVRGMDPKAVLSQSAWRSAIYDKMEKL